MLIRKYPPIKNTKLLDEYNKMPCVLTGGYGHNHHHIRRGKQRMDVVENLSTLNPRDHLLLDQSPEQFRAKWGEDRYRFLTTLKGGITIDDIYKKYVWGEIENE